MYNPFDEKTWKLIKGGFMVFTYTIMFLFAAYLIYLAFSTGFKDGRFAGIYDPPQHQMMEPEEEEVVNLRALLESTEALVAEGRELYMTNCASCHGDNGNGQGPKAAGLNPAPRDFSAPNSEWTNGNALLQIYHTLTDGVPGTSMASYSFIGDHERMALAHFVQTMVPDPQPNPQELIDELPVVEGEDAGTPAPGGTTSDTTASGDSIAATGDSASQANESVVPDGKTVPVAFAMQTLLDEQKEKAEKETRMMSRKLGDTFIEHCASCHGTQGQGKTYSREITPVGVIHTSTDPLVTSVNTLWAKNLQSFASFLTKPLPGFPEHNFSHLKNGDLEQIFRNLVIVTQKTDDIEQ